MITRGVRAASRAPLSMLDPQKVGHRDALTCSFR